MNKERRKERKKHRQNLTFIDSLEGFHHLSVTGVGVFVALCISIFENM